MKLALRSLYLVLGLALALSPAARAEKTPIAKGGGGEGAESVKEVDVSQTSGVDVDKLVERGHITIVDVFSQACGPCRVLAPKLEELARKKPGVALLKLNIGVRESEEGRSINFAAPIIDKYGIRGIPYLFVYGENGKLQSQGDDAYGQVIGWLREAKLIPGR